MNLYLSTAMAMLVREDMYTVTHGKVFTNLGRWGLVLGEIERLSIVSSSFYV